MGFLIFAYRKLFLKRKINDLNYQAMVLSQRKQTITNQIGLVQQAISSAKNAVSMSTQILLAAGQESVFNNYYNRDKDGKVTPKDGKDAALTQSTYVNELNAKTQAITYGAQLTNSLFDRADQAQLAYLNQLDSQISLQIANIDSQTKQLMPELESVEKAEDQAAKSEAPKFGLG